MDETHLIRHDEIRFRGPHHAGDQARLAEQFLASMPGVMFAKKRGPLCVEVEYNLKGVCHQTMRMALQQAGFHLDAALMEKIKCAFVDYTEQNRREAHGLDPIDLPPQKFQSKMEDALLDQQRMREQTPPEQPDDPWRHYL